MYVELTNIYKYISYICNDIFLARIIFLKDSFRKHTFRHQKKVKTL